MSDELLTTPQVKALGNTNLPILRWLLRHTDAIQPIANEAIAIKAAADAQEAWTHIKALGDIVVPIYADFPNLMTIPVYSEAEYDLAAMELNQAYGAHGEIIKILVDNLPAIIEAITRLWPLFSGK